MTPTVRMVVRRTTDSIAAGEVLTAAAIIGIALLLRAAAGLL